MAGAVSNLMVRAGFDGSQLTRGLQQMQGDVRGAQSSISSTLGTVGKVAGAAVLAAGAALATMGGIISKVGVQYDMAQENSKIAWTTLLGSADKAQKMLTDIANFAKNTQFDSEGVDAMAKYLNNAGYAGQQLFDQLTKVADVSGAFNITADNAKEMVRQMSQVDQAQVAYTEDLNILQDQGVPIFKAIASELGVNVAAVKKMASEGKITSKIYDEAFSNIAKSVKGASAAQSQTMSGMLSTLKDDFSIISGILAKPLFEGLHDGMTKLLPVMDGLVSLGKGDFKAFSDAITQSFGQQTSNKVMEFVLNVGKGMTVLKGALDQGKQVINDFFTGVKDIYKGGMGEGTGISLLGDLGFSSKQITLIQNFIASLKKALSELPGILDIFKGNTIQGIDFLTKLGLSPNTVVSITQTTVKIRDTITDFLNNIKKIGQTYLNDLSSGWTTIIQDIIGLVQGLLSGKNSIVNSFISIFNTIKSIVMPILTDIVNFIGSEFAQIKKWWDQYGGQITEAVKNFFAVLAAIFKVLAPVLLFIIQSVWDNIKGVIDGAIKIIQGIILVFTGIFTLNWKTLWDGIKLILGGAIEAVWNIINLLFIGRVLKGIGGFFGLIKEFFSGGWGEITAGIKAFVGGAEGWFGKLVEAAKTKFSDIIEAAKGIPGGIVEGLTSGLKTVTDGIAGLANELVKKFKEVLGIHSPSTVFADMGGHILDGLVNGLTSGNLLDLGKAVFKDFGGGVMNTVDKIKGFLTGAFSGGASGSVGGWLQQAMKIAGVPDSWLGPLSTIAQHESGGNPLAENHWDSNQKYGGTFGLMQMIIPTFQQYAMKGFGNILDPLSNAIASINYIKSRYGDVFNVPGIKSMLSGGAYKGYATGTNSAIAGWHMVGEEGPELMYTPGGSVIKNNRDTNKLLNGTNKTYNVTVNSLQASMDEKDLVRALQRMEALNNA